MEVVLHMGKGYWPLVGVLLLLGGTPVAGAGKLYRWVDENGTVHYGDSIPPQYAKTERQVINEQGVTVETMPAEKSAEERAREEQQQTAREIERQRAGETAQRDAILLNTYLSVEEIEDLRNRRVEILDGQIRVAELYLENLREKLKKLQADASRFQPYNSDPNAPPIHDWLAKELSNTLNSILIYEKTLEDTRVQQMELVAKFDADIDRFKTLKGLE